MAIGIGAVAILAFLVGPRTLKSGRFGNETQESTQAQSEPAITLSSLVGTYSCVTKGREFRFTETLEFTDGSFAIYSLNVQKLNSENQIIHPIYEPGRIFQASGPFRIDGSIAKADLNTEIKEMEGLEMRSGGIVVTTLGNPEAALAMTHSDVTERKKWTTPPPLTDTNPKHHELLFGLLIDEVMRDYSLSAPVDIICLPDGSIRLPNKHVLKRAAQS